MRDRPQEAKPMNKKKATKRPVRFEIEGPRLLELDELECLRQVTVIFAEGDEDTKRAAKLAISLFYGGIRRKR
jgi:hypothetical protein